MGRLGKLTKLATYCGGTCTNFVGYWQITFLPLSPRFHGPSRGNTTSILPCEEDLPSLSCGFYARGFTTHGNGCWSCLLEGSLPAVGIEEAVLEGEDGRFDIHLYWPKIHDGEVKDYWDSASSFEDIDEQHEGLEGFAEGSENGKFLLQATWVLVLPVWWI